MKPIDKTAAKLRESYDELSEMESASIKKEIRAAKRAAKKQMTKHTRNQGKRQLRDAMESDD